MTDFFMTFGLLLLFLGFPASIITTIVFKIKKKSTKISARCIPASILMSMIFLITGIRMYRETDEHNATMEQQRVQMEREEEIAQEENVISEEQNAQEMAEPEKEEIEQENENKSEQQTEESFLEELKKVLDEDVAEKSYEILINQIGFSEIDYIGKMDGLTNYEITANGYDVVITASDDVYRIFIPNSLYVFYEDGEVKLTFAELENKTIDQYDRSSYYIMAQDIICSGLKNPNSADFPSIVTHPEEIAMQRNGNMVAVQSYVDAKNDFGAKVRSDWIVEFEVIDIKTYSYNLIYANIDGQEYGEFIELE